MKRKSIIILALVASITSTAFAGFNAPLPEFKTPKQLAEWRAEMAAKSDSTPTTTQDTAFYTGKPYLASTGNYAFKYRSYNPELARWTSEDLGGFPDGANGNAYAPIPTSGFDDNGLKATLLYKDGVQAISLSVYVYDITSELSDWSMGSWKSDVEKAWKFSGTDISNQQNLSLNTTISFKLQTGGAFNSNWAASYDDVVIISNDPNKIPVITNNYTTGHWSFNITNDDVVHEIGHFMQAPDRYTVSYPDGPHGYRLTTPLKDETTDWNGTIMGGSHPRAATKLDANLVLTSLNEETHLFE